MNHGFSRSHARDNTNSQFDGFDFDGNSLEDDLEGSQQVGDTPSQHSPSLDYNRNAERFTEHTDATDATDAGSEGSVSSVYSGCSDSSVCSVIGRVEQAIADTQPTSESDLWKKIWNFARELKAIPELADAESYDLTEYVRVWHDALPPTIDDRYFEDTEEEFAEAWEKVLYAAGDGPVEHAFAIAVNSRPPSCAEQFEGEEIKVLASLCRELQLLSGDEPFYLACRTAGRLLGVSHAIAARWLRILARREILQVVTQGGPTTNKASRYRYLPQD